MNKIFPKLFFLKGEVYILGGYDENYQNIRRVDKYSPFTSKRSVVGYIVDDLCACAFINKICIFGYF